MQEILTKIKSPSKHYLFGVYKGIKARCYNRKSANYKYYGAKGITMCNEWLESYEKFIDDIGDRPSRKHQLHRENNKKGYCKDNCEWMSGSENVRIANRKLTNLQVYALKALLKQREEGIPHVNSKLMKMFNISKATIYAIKNGNAYSDVV